MTDQPDTLAININRLLIPASIILVGIVIAGAIFFGLKGSQAPSGQIQEPTEILGEVAPDQALNEQKPQANQTIKTSIDDDAVLGNKETAKVAIVEFSDFECPFCNRFRTQTLPQIQKDYIDTGKVILVFRDLPLSFHNPAAEQEAMAAECAREQGGDETYYQYHDQIFETSPGNGKGISVDGLVKIAQDLDLDGSQLRSCLEGEKYKEEVAKDAAEATKVGINGTPGFVVGKLSQDGGVEGVVVSGAQPFSVFQNIIDQLLDQV